MDAVSNSAFLTFAEEIIVKVFSHLDHISLSAVSLVCKELNRIAKDDRFWTLALSQRKIALIPGQAKSQLVASLRNYCSVLIENEYVDLAPQKGENVFAIVAKINASAQPILSAIFSLNLGDLAKLHHGHIDNDDVPDQEHDPIKIKMERDKKEHIMQTLLEAETKFSSTTSKFLLYRVLQHGCSYRTIELLVEQVPVNGSDIDVAIREKHSDDVVLLLISKVVKKESDENPLSKALREERCDRIIKELMERFEVLEEHICKAVVSGYSEEILKLLLAKSPSCDTDNAVGLALIRNDFSEGIIKMLVAQAREITGHDLESALTRDFSEETVALMIEKLPSDAYFKDWRANSIFDLANEHKYSNKILTMLIAKCSHIDQSSLNQGFSNSNPDEIVPLLIGKMGWISSNKIKAALEKGLSENIIKLLLAKVDEIESDIVLLAKKKNYSKELIQMLNAKCRRPDSSCTVM